MKLVDFNEAYKNKDYEEAKKVFIESIDEITDNKLKKIAPMICRIAKHIPMDKFNVFAKERVFINFITKRKNNCMWFTFVSPTNDMLTINPKTLNVAYKTDTKEYFDNSNHYEDEDDMISAIMSFADKMLYKEV